MNIAGTHSNPLSPSRILGFLGQYSGALVGAIIALALIFFEMFNYSTTDFALRDLLGELKFFGIHWSTLLSIAFCGIDFAGIVRLFSSDRTDTHNEVWYLFGAWMLAATMNAVLTWWGVSMAIANHVITSGSVVNPQTIFEVIPIFVAVMVWIIRILLIGSISIAGDRILLGNTQRRSSMRGFTNINAASSNLVGTAATSMRHASNSRPSVTMSTAPSRAEPTYHGINSDAKPVYKG